jgi:hypothetical protein
MSSTTSPSATRSTPVVIPDTIPTDEFELNRRNSNILFNEFANCKIEALRPKLYITCVEYIMQSGMLKKYSVIQLISERASMNSYITYDTKSPADISYVKEAIAIIDGYLESEGHYTVTPDRFYENYDKLTTRLISHFKQYTTVYAASLVAYMNRAAASAWKELALEKKAGIRARVMVWKELPISSEFGLAEKCVEFLEKYKMW